ncbi:hypothetical protein Hamer_G015920 [Homarus americanus]|uniref:Uncharacterized protein n=1 Tax=Homarus americanus TaxID=6706 RepID=A0A8J5MMI6_HOMAM|nr:hypothetical protein Hamer_G015920 [Homarus americanus]
MIVRISAICNSIIRHIHKIVYYYVDSVQGRRGPSPSEDLTKKLLQNRHHSRKVNPKFTGRNRNKWEQEELVRASCDARHSI